MKILFISYAFHPQVGGIESSALLLIREFQLLGHEVKVVTNVELGNADEVNLVEVHRRPGLREQYQLAKWSNIVYHHHPAFTYWLPTAIGRPTVASVRTWISRTDRSDSWKDLLKRRLLAKYSCIANSRATATHLSGKPVVIENAYDDQVFSETTPWTERRGAAFVGRLVSDKGVATAIGSIAIAKRQGALVPLTIIGSGPEESALRELAVELGIEDLVSFAGRLRPDAVSRELNSARYLLVPSKWEEPFGIVALEGIACGCVPFGTDQGGLVDAIGKCGPLFPKDDEQALGKLLVRAESDPSFLAEFRDEHETHLAAHTPGEVAARYLDVFSEQLC